jgi:hypothetical protein
LGNWFFSMNPNWLFRFHDYHTFGDYLNSHLTILAMVKLCLSNYCNVTNLLWGNRTSITKGLAHHSKGVMHPHNLEIPSPPNFQTTKPNTWTKLVRLLTYIILQLEPRTNFANKLSHSCPHPIPVCPVSNLQPCTKHKFHRSSRVSQSFPTFAFEMTKCVHHD